MGIVTSLVIGLVVGLVISALTKSRGLRQGIILVVSVVGAMIGWLNVAFLYNVPGAYFDLNWIVILAALIGAALAAGLFGLLKPHKGTAAS